MFQTLFFFYFAHDAARCLSWELGTRAQAVLELDAQTYSVFSNNQLPPPIFVPSDMLSGMAPVFSIAQTTVATRNASNGLNTTGPQPLMKDGSAADPASIGVAVLLANWTSQGGENYNGAARDQLQFLLGSVPKTSDGAISHRVAEVQLWYAILHSLLYYADNM
jgi:hypothetical protein